MRWGLDRAVAQRVPLKFTLKPLFCCCLLEFCTKCVSEIPLWWDLHPGSMRVKMREFHSKIVCSPQNLSFFFLYSDYYETMMACSVILIHKISEFTGLEQFFFPVPNIQLILVSAGHWFLSTDGSTGCGNHCLGKSSLLLILLWLWQSFNLKWDRDPAEYPQLQKERHLFCC